MFGGILENREGSRKTRVTCFGYLMIPEKWNNSAVRYAR